MFCYVEMVIPDNILCNRKQCKGRPASKFQKYHLYQQRMTEFNSGLFETDIIFSHNL